MLTHCPHKHEMPEQTSLEDLGAATGELVNFVDHEVQSPLEVLKKSFGLLGLLSQLKIIFDQPTFSEVNMSKFVSCSVLTGEILKKTFDRSL